MTQTNTSEATQETKTRNPRVSITAKVDASQKTGEISYAVNGLAEPVVVPLDLFKLTELQLYQAATVGLNTFITNSYGSLADPEEIKAAIDTAVAALANPEKGYKSRLFRDPTTVGQRDEVAVSVVAYLRLMSKAYVMAGKAAIAETAETYTDFTARWRALSEIKRNSLSATPAFQAEFKQIQIERATAKLETAEVKELSLDDLLGEVEPESDAAVVENDEPDTEVTD